MTLAYLCFFSFLSGFIDSIAGGGGLIQLPALMIFLPNLSVPLIFGTNKIASLCGTSTSLVLYARKINLRWRVFAPAALAALIFSYFGARTVSILPSEMLKPLVLLLLVCVMTYTFWRKDLGRWYKPRSRTRHELPLALLSGTALGFYDGFFGPGTGSFLIFAFIGIFGFDFLTASASAKIINVATNVSAVFYFARTDNIIYSTGLSMGLFNLLGSVVGTRLAISKGNTFVRMLFLVVSGALILKLALDL